MCVLGVGERACCTGVGTGALATLVYNNVPHVFTGTNVPYLCGGDGMDCSVRRARVTLDLRIQTKYNIN